MSSNGFLADLSDAARAAVVVLGVGALAAWLLFRAIPGAALFLVVTAGLFWGATAYLVVGGLVDGFTAAGPRPGPDATLARKAWFFTRWLLGLAVPALAVGITAWLFFGPGAFLLVVALALFATGAFNTALSMVLEAEAANGEQVRRTPPRARSGSTGAANGLRSRRRHLRSRKEH